MIIISFSFLLNLCAAQNVTLPTEVAKFYFTEHEYNKYLKQKIGIIETELEGKEVLLTLHQGLIDSYKQDSINNHLINNNLKEIIKVQDVALKKLKKQKNKSIVLNGVVGVGILLLLIK